MAILTLIRHGQSQWNAKGLWTGWTDIPLSDDGRQEAHRTATVLSGIKFDAGFTSDQIRAKETLQIILKDLALNNIPVKETPSLKEKNYGNYTGKNKWQIQKEAGEELFQKIRRSWDFVIPDGESLKIVYERVVNFYKENILPELKKGNNIIVTASGNSLRALVKFLDNIPDDQIADLEITTGEADVYQIDENGKVVSKEIRARNTKLV